MKNLVISSAIAAFIGILSPLAAHAEVVAKEAGFRADWFAVPAEEMATSLTVERTCTNNGAWMGANGFWLPSTLTEHQVEQAKAANELHLYADFSVQYDSTAHVSTAYLVDSRKEIPAYFKALPQGRGGPKAIIADKECRSRKPIALQGPFKYEPTAYIEAAITGEQDSFKWNWSESVQLTVYKETLETGVRYSASLLSSEETLKNVAAAMAEFPRKVISEDLTQTQPYYDGKRSERLADGSLQTRHLRTYQLATGHTLSLATNLKTKLSSDGVNWSVLSAYVVATFGNPGKTKSSASKK